MNIIESKQKEMEQLMAQFTKEMEEMKSNYQAKFDKLKEEIEQEKEKGNKPFIKEGQGYYSIKNNFEVGYYNYEGNEYENNLISIGNCYPYTEDDEDEVFEKVSLIAERRKLQSEMELFARLNDKGEIDWNNIAQQKWYLYIRHRNNKITLEYTYDCRELNTTYFTSKEVAQKALEKFKDEIKRLYLN